MRSELHSLLETLVGAGETIRRAKTEIGIWSPGLRTSQLDDLELGDALAAILCDNAEDLVHLRADGV